MGTHDGGGFSIRGKGLDGIWGVLRGSWGTHDLIETIRPLILGASRTLRKVLADILSDMLVAPGHRFEVWPPSLGPISIVHNIGVYIYDIEYSLL